MHVVLFLGALASSATAYTIVEADLFMHKNVDAVVMLGQYKSHLHSFFGSDAVTANTTTSAELQAGCTTADNSNDFSSYCISLYHELSLAYVLTEVSGVPTLFYIDGTTYTEVPFNRFSAYYIGINPAEVAIPQNFKVVVGNSSAISQADVPEPAGIQWFCEGDAGETKDEAAFPTSTCSTHLQTLLLFHDCVNEETLESTYSGTQNWNSTYKATNRCPEGMKRMPQLRFSIRYDLKTILPAGWSGTAPFE
jgi:hypothetical protein